MIDADQWITDRSGLLVAEILANFGELSRAKKTAGHILVCPAVKSRIQALLLNA
jgi:hypothetical protein